MIPSMKLAPASPNIPQDARCGNCFHGKIAPSMDGQVNVRKRHCFEGPPQGIAIPQWRKTLNGFEPVGVQVMYAFPEVDANQRCHRWAPAAPNETDADQVSTLLTGKKAQ